MQQANKKCKHFNIYKKYRKTPRDIIILHMCTKHLDDMIYSSWDIECVRLKLVIICHYGHYGHFLLFYPQAIKTRKTRILKKRKKLLEIPSFYTLVYHKWWSYDVWFLRSWFMVPYKCAWKITIIWCMLPKICTATHIVLCHFGPFFDLSPH